MEKPEFIKVRGRNFFCQLCDIKITSEQAVNDHLTGKKHQRILRLRLGRQQQVQRSIFVGGLSRLNGELELGDYFSKYGEVSQIIIDKEKAHYAIIEFANQESVKKATEVEKQLLNGRKIVVRPRQPKPATPQTKGSGTSRSKLAGKGGRGKQKFSPQQPQMDEVLYQGLQQEETVSGQMSTLVQLTELSAANQRLRHLICDLLQSVLEEFLPGCRITPFGSSINGFGIQGCDLDIHLELGDSASTLSDTPEDSMSAGEELQNQPGPSDDCMTLDIASATPLDVLSLVSDVIKRCVPSCHNVHTIPSARLPVVKFTHKESGLQCDISMNNRLALQNTKLLQFYSSLETQVRPLVFTIRYWAKFHQLAGNAGAGPRLTNYALTLMVLFYLQAKDNPVLPSVSELMCSGDGWDSSFSVSNTLSTTRNSETQDNLLAGFFGFYDKFDFTTTVICPLLGKTASLSEVLHTAEGFGDSGRCFKTGAVNIQDPFELWHNVALNVNVKTAERLSEEIGIAASQSEMMQEARESLEDNSWGLLALFESSARTPCKTQCLFSSPSVSDTESSSDVTRLEINLKSSHLSKRFIAEYPDPADLKLAWCDAVKGLAYHVIAESLRFECHWSLSDLNKEITDTVEEVKTSEKTVKQEHNSRKGSTNLITPRLAGEVSQNLKSARLTGSAGIDSPAESAIHLNDSDSDGGEPPPCKRCRVDLTSEDCPSPSLHCARNANEEVPTCTQCSTNPWHVGTKILQCTAYHPVWLGRRKARRQMLQSKHKPQEASHAESTTTDTKQSSIDQGDNTHPGCMATKSLGSTVELDSASQVVATSLTDDLNHHDEKTRATRSRNIPSHSNVQDSINRICDTQTGSQLASDSLLLESQVTDLIISDKFKEDCSSVAPIMKFTLRLTDNITKGGTSIVMHFLPVTGDSDFKVFLHFFDIYFKKMLDQCKI